MKVITSDFRRRQRRSQDSRPLPAAEPVLHHRGDHGLLSGGPFAQEARELGIPYSGAIRPQLLRTYRPSNRMIREGGYIIIHCHGARGNMMGALLRCSTGLPVVTTVHLTTGWTIWAAPLPPHLRHHQHHRPAPAGLPHRRVRRHDRPAHQAGL